MENINWFEVDKEGLRQLQAGKPKSYLVRELVQNAWDENVKIVKLNIVYDNIITMISVQDDNPTGFRDMSDAYTLYKETYKREDPTKRGRFNLGEKQAFSICDKAIVTTTKGTIIFDENGRREESDKRKNGSEIKVWLKMTKQEFEEIIESVNNYLVPKGIKFYINNRELKYKKPEVTFETRLVTEISSDKILRRTMRSTIVNLYKSENNYLYEIGIPVTKIDCEYSIDVQQKIPLGIDRETVSQVFLRELFAEVLNNTYENISEESTSQQWIREAMGNKRINREAVETIVEKRYGDKVCIADPFDKNSIDEAISNGYNIIRGSEMSKEEWSVLRKFKDIGETIIESSSKLFNTNFTSAETIEPTQQQQKVIEYAKKIARRLLKIDISVDIVKMRDGVAAQYGSRKLTLNYSKLGNRFFEKPVSEMTTNLLLHELGHEAGNHTESEYHSLITKMAGQLVILALEEPEFFDI